MIYRLILPEWAKAENPTLPKVLEGEFTDSQITNYNLQGYNIYYLPNYPKEYNKGVIVNGTHIDCFEYVFADFDLKQRAYPTKDAFINELANFGITPNRVVDSGNGIHVYWKVVDLNPMDYLRLQRRLIRRLNSDDSLAKIYQLMRVPGTFNTKVKGQEKLCEVLYQNDDVVYTCEQLDKALPILSKKDEAYCVHHYNKTYNIQDKSQAVDDTLPLKFCQLLKTNSEIKSLWASAPDDRSIADYRLGHLLFANGLTKDEAMSVLVNASKAIQRSAGNRIGYASSIVDKIWVHEMGEQKERPLSRSVLEILQRGDDVVKGTKFPCHPLLDNTVYGFRLGHVIGLVAGSGVGKTSVALNMFLWFTERNPDYDHFFVTLEQTDNEIANRWRTITQGDTRLHGKVHILSNYDEDGKFRHLSLDDIKDYILEFQKTSGKKIGTVVIDHIGALRKQSKNGENQAIVDICHRMKSFAVETNTLVIMQSQAPREKAGIGDLELSKDCAYGTVFFESYVDYLLAVWQPLKRVYFAGAPTIMAFKYAKIRHKKQGQDVIQEDVRYQLFFDPSTERLRELTQNEETSVKFFLSRAISERNLDKKTDIVPYISAREDAKVPQSIIEDTGDKH